MAVKAFKCCCSTFVREKISPSITCKDPVRKKEIEREKCSFILQPIIFIRTWIKEINYANFSIADLLQDIVLVFTNDCLRLVITVIRSWEDRGLRPLKRFCSVSTENEGSIKLTDNLTRTMAGARSHCCAVSKDRNERNSKGVKLTSNLIFEKLWYNMLIM